MIKYGPKGIWALSLDFLDSSEGSTTNVPSNEPMEITSKLLKPEASSTPKNIPYFTSPPPIYLPLDRKYSKAKIPDPTVTPRRRPKTLEKSWK